MLGSLITSLLQLEGHTGGASTIYELEQVMLNLIITSGPGHEACCLELKRKLVQKVEVQVQIARFDELLTPAEQLLSPQERERLQAQAAKTGIAQ